MKRKGLFTSLCIFSAVGALAQEDTPLNDQARFLAGLPIVSGPLVDLAAQSGYGEHQSGMEKAWSDVETRQLSEIRSWAPTHLGTIYGASDPLFYFYSGPDFLYANAFFPEASTYLLCGKEPVGDLPDVTALSDGGRVSALRGLRHALESSLRFSFFITADMKKDLTNTQLTGTLPVLYVYLARMGHWLRLVEIGGLDEAGNWTTSSESAKTQGVRIVFEGASGVKQTLYYFTTDLSNWGIKNRPEFIAFCKQFGSGNGLVKSASYLMHLNDFSASRDFLLQQVKTLVQDDSGIPYRHFGWDDWMVACHGVYAGPIDLFKNKHQDDLARAFRAQAPSGLPFGIGYRWRKNESGLVIATSLREIPKALPAALVR